MDAKLLTKILANDLNVVLKALVLPDQPGFMPGMGYTHTVLVTPDSQSWGSGIQLS